MILIKHQFDVPKSSGKCCIVRQAIAFEASTVCEAVLLENGSKQVDIWGADWYPLTQEVGYESLINIRPRQNNRSMEIQDPMIRDRVAQIVQRLLGEL